MITTRNSMKLAHCLLKRFVPCYLGTTASSSSQQVPSTTDGTTPSAKWHVEERKLSRLDTSNRFLEVPQVWVTNFNAIEEERLGIMDLHPDVFRVFPRMDILAQNIRWQNTYRNVSYVKALSRAEMPGGGRKHRKQTGLGRSRAGSIRAPQWVGGGVANGIRGPKTWFYVLPDSLRLKGLCIALSIKHGQDDLVVVDSFHDLPSVILREKQVEEYEDVDEMVVEQSNDWNQAQILDRMASTRNWGYSVLFIDLDDECPDNLAIACAENDGFTAMPYYGLNCYSIMKHETLVMTKAAVEKVEERLLHQLHRADSLHKPFRYMDYKRQLLDESEMDDVEDEYMPPFV